MISERETGIVKWFNNDKGYGFIQRRDGEDLFVHFRDIEGQGRRTFKEGETVSFKVVHDHKGLRAEKVRSED